MMVCNIASNDPNTVFTTIIKELQKSINYSGDSFYEPSIAIRRIYDINVRLAEHIFLIDDQRIITVFVVNDADMLMIHKAENKYNFSMIGKYPTGSEIHDIISIISKSAIANYREDIKDFLSILISALPQYSWTYNRFRSHIRQVNRLSPWEFYCNTIFQFYYQTIKEDDQKSLDYLLENRGWIDTLEWIIRKSDNTGS